MPWYKGKHYAYTAEGRAQHKRDMQKDKTNPHPRPRDLKDATGLRDTRTPEPKMVAAGLRKPTAASRAATQEQREKAKALVAMGFPSPPQRANGQENGCSRIKTRSGNSRRPYCRAKKRSLSSLGVGIRGFHPPEQRGALVREPVRRLYACPTVA